VRDFVTKDVQVLNSERIIGYNTYNNILQRSKEPDTDQSADFYNVTVNFVMKRTAPGDKHDRLRPKDLPVSVYESSVNALELHQQQLAQEKAEQQPDDASDP
jgi:hypothetical protein